jgi:hypothetical protein
VGWGVVIGVHPVQLLRAAMEGRRREEGRDHGGEGAGQSKAGVGADIGSEGVGAGEAAGASGADDIDVVASAGVVTTRVIADAEVAADAREAAVRVTTDPGETVEVEVLAGAAVEAVEKAPGAGEGAGCDGGGLLVVVHPRAEETVADAGEEGSRVRSQVPISSPEAREDVRLGWVGAARRGGSGFVVGWERGGRSRLEGRRQRGGGGWLGGGATYPTGGAAHRGSLVTVMPQVRNRQSTNAYQTKHTTRSVPLHTKQSVPVLRVDENIFIQVV